MTTLTNDKSRDAHDIPATVGKQMLFKEITELEAQ